MATVNQSQPRLRKENDYKNQLVAQPIKKISWYPNRKKWTIPTNKENNIPFEYTIYMKQIYLVYTILDISMSKLSRVSRCPARPPASQHSSF